MITYIDPNDVTKFDRTPEELELFLLFCLVVAGKTAKTQARLLDNFLKGNSPFQYLRILQENNKLLEELKIAKLGQYNRLLKAITQLLSNNWNLTSVTVDELETISGIGPKTSRFFILHTRSDQKLAVIDTHILKFLKDQGYDVPKVTPTKNKYMILEQIWIRLAENSGKSLAEFDLEIWKYYSTKKKNDESLYSR